MSETSRKKLGTTQIILIVGFLLLIAAVGIGAYYIVKNMNTQVQQEPVGNIGGTGSLVVDDSNLTTIGEEMQSKVDDGMFEVNMNTVWNFPDGKSASTDAYVANATSNHYPISFDIIINDTEVIYSSTIIPMGNRIKEIKLDKELESGQYAAICLYHLWQEDGTENSQFGVNVTLNIIK